MIRGVTLQRVLGGEAFFNTALIGTLASMIVRPINDPDLWWHLAAGDRILDGLGIPWTDPFSYVAKGNEWLAYSWLPEVMFSACARHFGLGSLVLLAAAVNAATLGIVLSTCRLRARHQVAFLATMAAGLVASPGWTVRPHLVSFLCMAIFSRILVEDRMRPTRRVWLLVPTMVLWANSHILFPFGLLLLAFHAATRGRSRIALLAAVTAASLVTPYGWHLWGLAMTIGRQPVALSLISEFQSPSLHDVGGLAFTLFFFATAIALILSPAPKPAEDLLRVFVFALLGYGMARNAPFFAIVTAPVLAGHVEALLPGRPAPYRSTHERVAFHALLLGAGAIALAAHTSALFRPGAAVAHIFPTEAVRFLESQPPLGRLFNDFDWGGYLIGHLYPRYQVSMDGRTQVYGEETLRQYKNLVSLAPDWRTYLDRCDPDVILWSKQSALSQLLLLLPEWDRRYEDDLAIIFVRRSPHRASPQGAS